MNLAERIDHTLLKPEALPADIDRVCTEAVDHGFASVCVNAVYAARVAQALRGTPVKACAVAGFPLGGMKFAIKAIEASSAVKDGAAEIDFVAHLPSLLKKDLAAAKAEFMEVVRTCRMARADVVVKVIVETAALMDGVDSVEAEARIEVACRAARESGCDFIKTSTGFHPGGGASSEAVFLLKKHAQGLLVKASGGIRTHEDAIRMIEAGADRLGCSASVAIASGERPAEAGY